MQHHPEQNMMASTWLQRALGRAVFAALTTLAALAGSPAQAGAGDERFIAAMRLYHEDRYAAAYGRMVELADEGHAEAARVALMMLRLGPTLYRSQWSASQDQIQHWQALASRRQAPLVADGAD
jgi:hypothetical protein